MRAEEKPDRKKKSASLFLSDWEVQWAERISTLRRLLPVSLPSFPEFLFQPGAQRPQEARPARPHAVLTPDSAATAAAGGWLRWAGQGGNGRGSVESGQWEPRPWAGPRRLRAGFWAAPCAQPLFLQLPGSRWRVPPGEALGRLVRRTGAAGKFPAAARASVSPPPARPPLPFGTAGARGWGWGWDCGWDCGSGEPALPLPCGARAGAVRWRSGGFLGVRSAAPLLIARRCGVTPAPASLRSRCAVRPASPASPASPAPQCASPPPRPSHSCSIQGTAASAPGKGSLRFELPRDTPGWLMFARTGRINVLGKVTELWMLASFWV